MIYHVRYYADSKTDIRAVEAENEAEAREAVRAWVQETFAPEYDMYRIERVVQVAS